MKRLQRWLDENGKTQRELADDCQLSPGAISQYINGTTDPSIDTLKLLAKTTGLSTDELLFGDEPAIKKARPTKAIASPY